MHDSSQIFGAAMAGFLNTSGGVIDVVAADVEELSEIDLAISKSPDDQVYRVHFAGMDPNRPGVDWMMLYRQALGMLALQQGGTMKLKGSLARDFSEHFTPHDVHVDFDDKSDDVTITVQHARNG